MFGVSIFGSNRDLKALKKKNIEELRLAYPSMKTQSADDSLHEILFDILGVYSTLRITLSTNFPISKPVIKVVGSAMHPWLDMNQMVIGSPKLNVWTKTSSLRDVVAEILYTLQSATNNNVAALSHSSNYNIPVYPAISQRSAVYSYPAAEYKQSQIQSGGGNNNNNNNIYHQQQQYMNQQQQLQLNLQRQQNGYIYNDYKDQSIDGIIPKSSSTSSLNEKTNIKESEKEIYDPIHVPIPEIPLTFPELEQLTDIQLQRLLDDKEALKAHMKNIAVVSRHRQLREEHRKTNEEIALETLKMGDELISIEREANNLKKELNEVILRYKQKLSDSSRKYGTSKEELFRILECQSNSLDDSSETLAQQFMNGEIPLSDFIEQYKKLRIEFHSLDSKLKLCRKR